MADVTERAKEALLRRKLLASIRSPDVGLRLEYVSTGEIVLVPDRIRAGDQVVTYGDSTVLLVDAELSESLLADWTVDWRESEGGWPGLVLSATVSAPLDSGVVHRQPRRIKKRGGRPWPPPAGAGPLPPATAA